MDYIYNYIETIKAHTRVAYDKLVDLPNYKYSEKSNIKRISESPNLITETIICWSEPTQIIDHLYLGSAHNAANFNHLNNNHIKVVINMAEELSNYFPSNFEYHNFKSYDNNKTDMKSHIKNAYNIIKQNDDKNILVHCYVGASRSVSVILYYLVKEGHCLTVQEAIEYIKEKRTIINPTFKIIENINELLEDSSFLE